MESWIQTSLNFLLKRVMTFDVETTTTNKGSPFTLRNKLVTIQIKNGNDTTRVFKPEEFHEVPAILRSASMLVATNSKFDLHWLQRELGFQAASVWDCQIAEFLLSRQLWIYPDLATMCDIYGVDKKLDIVKLEYWDKGIDTDEIPFDVLAEYGARDVDATYQVFLKQLDILTSKKSSLFRLFRTQCNDLLALQEMEYNGILYDAEASLTAAEELNEQIARIDAELQAKYGMGIPINFDSRDDISTLLYGGHIGVDSKIPIGVFKTGARTGETKFKNITTEYAFPRLVEPLKGSELKKEGFFSTDADTLVSLKPDKMTRQLINKLLERAKVKKLQSTYLTGFPKIIGVMEWENNILHSNLNQCSVVTGRLSSTKPNQQNLPKEAKRHCVTRY